MEKRIRETAQMGIESVGGAELRRGERSRIEQAEMLNLTRLRKFKIYIYSSPSSF